MQQPQSFWSFICCQDEEQDQLPNKVDHRPDKTQLELFGNINTRNYMLVRQTQKNFFVDYQQRKTKRIDQSPQLVYFSYFDKGVKFERGEEMSLIPEKVLQYIARRIHEVDPSIVIDAMCRSGAAAIQIAIECSAQVLAFNHNATQIKNAMHNQSLVTLRGNCNFLLGKLPTLPTIKGDVLFMNPEFESHNEHNFTLKEHINPRIDEILHDFPKNVVIILPNTVSLHELCELIAKEYKHARKEELKLEIQKIQVDGQLDNYVIYLGDIAAVSTQDEYIMMTQMVLEDSHFEVYQEATYLLLKSIGQSVSGREVMDTLLYAREMAQVQSETTLQQFISQCLFRRYTNDQTIKQLFGALEDDMQFMNETPQYNQICQAQTFGQEQFENLIESPQKKKQPAQKKTHISFTKQGVSINNNANDCLVDLLNKD